MRLDGFDQRVAIGDHIVYLGARGQFSVVGDDISSTVTGAHITFMADGAGHARIAGDGSYRINGGPRASWSQERPAR
ncbi:MAG: hypothetical protein O3B31_09800 [Chloroflexi bacterium]|nr:hypothetical protein [Chloroflexota bacterium]MDA1003620.1 hypothetical protein [Chloroflexota bacterium]